MGLLGVCDLWDRVAYLRLFTPLLLQVMMRGTGLISRREKKKHMDPLS